MKETFNRLLRETGVIAILRGIAPGEVPAVCDTLIRQRIVLIEIPLNSPDAVAGIAAACRHTAGRALIGAGTVLTAAEVAAVKAAGGSFIISPATDPAVIRATVGAGLISIPGFLTPSEAFTALAAGADYLKLFPAGRLGVGYLRDLRAVLKAPVIAVGGVTPENCREYLDYCAGVGLGSALYRPGMELAELERIASGLIA